MTVKEIKEKIKKGFYNVKDSLSDSQPVSEDVRNLIRSMIESDRDKRIKIDEILEHPWL